jgi:hypothetical protein
LKLFFQPQDGLRVDTLEESLHFFVENFPEEFQIEEADGEASDPNPRADNQGPETEEWSCRITNFLERFVLADAKPGQLEPGPNVIKLFCP